MKFIVVFAVLAAMAFGAPHDSLESSSEEITKEDRGIEVYENGSPDGPEGAVVSSRSFSMLKVKVTKARNCLRILHHVMVSPRKTGLPVYGAMQGCVKPPKKKNKWLCGTSPHDRVCFERPAVYISGTLGVTEHQCSAHRTTMKCMIVFVALAAVALGAPQYNYGSQESDEIPILKDQRDRDDYGRYSVDVETGNGIVLNDNGSPDGPEGAVVASGSFSYTSPEGVPVVVQYVANENGFQPQSDLLPVAPEFPHPIPQFVLDQIAFAAQQSSEEYSRYD